MLKPASWCLGVDVWICYLGMAQGAFGSEVGKHRSALYCVLVIALFTGLDFWEAYRMFVEARNYSPESKETVSCSRSRTLETR